MDLTLRSSTFVALGFLIATGCSRSPAPVNREAGVRALGDGAITAFVWDWGGKDAERTAAHCILTTNDPTSKKPATEEAGSWWSFAGKRLVRGKLSRTYATRKLRPQSNSGFPLLND
jgi:hypothetical protein